MNTNPPNFEILPWEPPKPKKERKVIDKETESFKVQVQTVVSNLPEKIHHYKFRTLAACVEYCKEHYKNYLFCAVENKIIVDNMATYRINPNLYTNYKKLKANENRNKNKDFPRIHPGEADI